jgi:hypothetical protein
MLQKLYRLLEDIDNNTRQQHIEATHTRISINELGKEIALRNQLDPGKPPEPEPRHAASWPNHVVSWLGIVAILVFSYFSYRCFGSTQRMMERSEESSARENYSYSRYNEVKLLQVNMEDEVLRLDSIVRQQNESIVELKKLNEMAVKTFIRIRRDMERRERWETNQNNLGGQ